MRRVGIWVFTLIVLFLHGVQVNAQAVKSSSKKSGKQKELVVAIADNQTGLRLQTIEPVAAYLSKELKMPVRAVTANNAIELIKMIEERKVDIAFINGFGYVMGVTDSVPLLPLVVTGNRDGKPNTYNSCIISSPSKGIKSMADMVVRSGEYSFLFVNPTSTSGHLIPRLYMSKLGVKQMEIDFKEVGFADSHYGSIEKVVSGEVDAGAAAYNIIEAKLAKGELKKEDINVLWVSEPITQEPVVVHRDMDRKLHTKITKALLQIHTNDPVLWKHIQDNFSAKNATNYVPAKDEYYNSIRNVSGKIEDLLFILNFYIN